MKNQSIEKIISMAVADAVYERIASEMDGLISSISGQIMEKIEKRISAQEQLVVAALKRIEDERVSVERKYGYIGDLTQFMEDRLEACDGATLGSAVLYEEYREWGRLMGINPPSDPTLASHFQKAGLVKVRTRNGSEWKDIRIKHRAACQSHSQDDGIDA